MTTGQSLEQMQKRTYAIRHLHADAGEIRLALETRHPTALFLYDAALTFRQVASVSRKAGDPYAPASAASVWEPVTLLGGTFTDWEITSLTLLAGMAIIRVEEKREEGPIQNGSEILRIQCAAIDFVDSFAWRRSGLAVLQSWPVVLAAALAVFIAPGLLMQKLVPGHSPQVFFITACVLIAVLAGRGLRTILWNWPVAAIIVFLFSLAGLQGFRMASAADYRGSLLLFGLSAAFILLVRRRSALTKSLHR